MCNHGVVEVGELWWLLILGKEDTQVRLMGWFLTILWNKGIWAFHIHTFVHTWHPKTSCTSSNTRVHKWPPNWDCWQVCPKPHTFSTSFLHAKASAIPKWSPLFRICHVAYKAPIHMLNKQMEWHWAFF